MRQCFIVLVLLFGLVGGGSVSAFGQQSFVVEEVLEGDLLQMDNGEIVKMIGLNIPEDKREESREFVQSLVKGRRVSLLFDSEKYNDEGQMAAYVYIIELFVNASVISAGYAEADENPPNTRHTGLFKSLYDQAKVNRRGVWR
jgi:endonuclease YncB( thermonuclease family)